MKNDGLSIVVPVYNESQGISNTILELKEISRSFDFNYEVILVNDGSNDGTENILNDVSYENFTVIHHKMNHGYGAALKTGIKNSSYDYFAITDADGTYPNDLIPDFFQNIVSNNHDMVVGSRTGDNVHIPFIRKPAKFALNFIADYLTNLKIPDLNSGFRVMKKGVVEKFLNILPDSFSFTTTITLAMFTNGHSVEYIPINYNQRKGKSKIRPIYDTLNFLQLIIKTVLYFDPLKIFLPISCLFFFISIIMVLYRLFVSEAFAVTSVILFVCGIQLLALGMIADLIDKRFKR